MSILLESPSEHPEDVALGTDNSFSGTPGVDWDDIESYALFSGGYDSVVATYQAMEHGDAEAVLHLDTTTGIPENEQYVIELCREFGWPLRIERAPITLYEFATGEGKGDRSAYGFPGPGAHLWAYALLKERSLRRVAKQANAKPRYLTGVRKHESTRRKMNVSTEAEETNRWIWEAPIAEYRDFQIKDTLQDKGLPANPVVESIGRSGECWCLAYDSRDDALIDLKAGGYDTHADRLLDIEGRAQEEIGTQEDHCYIGHGKASSNTLKSLMADNDKQQMKLCQGCKSNCHAPGADEHEEEGD